VLNAQFVESRAPMRRSPYGRGRAPRARQSGSNAAKLTVGGVIVVIVVVGIIVLRIGSAASRLAGKTVADEMVTIARRIRPEMAMLVPEGRHEVTTEGGLDIVSQEKSLKKAVERLAAAGIVVSVFIDAERRQVEAAKRIGAAVCEVHTGPYAHAFHSKGRDAESPAVVSELKKIQTAGELIRSIGMRFNAGHALNYFNVEPVARLPGVRELHIGHAVVSRALFVGMREAVREMKQLMVQAAR